MTTTLTPNLKLRIDSKLTSNAKYNLQRIDLLGATFLVDSTNTLNIRSQTDILIDPNSPDLGGSGRGSVTMGDADRKLTSLTVHADELLLNGAFNLKDQAVAGTGKLGLLYKSDLEGAADSGDLTLSLDMNGANRELVLGGNLSLLGGNLVLNANASGSNVIVPQAGTLVAQDTTDTLSNKSIDVDNNNTITNLRDSSIASNAAIDYLKLALAGKIKNSDISSDPADKIAYSKLNLAGSLVDSDVAASAAIAYSKLALASSITNTDISPTANIDYAKLDLFGHITDSDIASDAGIAGTKVAPQFGNQNIRTSATVELDNGTHITSLAPASSGQTESIVLRLPNNNGANNAVLATDGAGNLRWSSSGTGSVTDVGLTTPAEFIPGPNVTVSGNLSFTKANQEAGKVYAGPETGAAAQPSFRSLVLTDLPSGIKSYIGLGNVANVDSTDPSTIIQTSSYRFSTDTEKSTWNGKQNALGFTPEDSANKGIANGYAALDATGKIPNSYLPTSTMNYHGTWNVATNTPALSDGMIGADPGDIYIVSVGGTRNLGSGNITFAVGDWAIYNQSNVWEKVINSNTVSSVNGAQGAVTVNAINELTGDVTAGPASGSQSQVATIAAGAITNAKVSASAAIAVSKLATGTNGQVLQVVAGVPTWGAAPVSVLAFKADWVTADGTTKGIIHSLGTSDVLIQIFDKSNGQSVEVDSIIRSSINAVSLTASQAPGASGWRVLILAI